MNALTPKQAAVLSELVYSTRRSLDIPVRFRDAGLKVTTKARRLHTSILKGETGYGIVKKKNAFGMSALIERNNGRRELVLVFRGTFFTSAHDLLTNVDTGVRTGKTGKRIHVGFAGVLDSLICELNRVIPQSGALFDIHIMGHSLGGAVATLVADWVRTNTAHNAQLYTFGAPRVGFESFAKQFTERLSAQYQHRVFHETDAIPTTPVFPFTHAPSPGVGYELSSKELGLFDAHRMTEYIESVANQSWKQLDRRLPSFTRETILQKWIIETKPFVLADAIGISKISQTIAMLIAKKVDGHFVEANIWAGSGSTIADSLARLFHEGVTKESLLDEGPKLFFLFLAKLARSLGMRIKGKIVEKLEEMTLQTIRQIFNALMLKVRMIVDKALSHMQTQF